MPNAQRYTPPEGYYETTKDRSPSQFLRRAIELAPQKGTALDLGCGAGSDTALLLRSGFIVEAVDGNQEAEIYIKQLPHQNNVHFVCSEFETFQFKNYDLINSARSLPFIHKSQFKDVMGRLFGSLKRNGVFVGEFYGDKDQWNKPGETMTFLTRQDVEALLKDLKIITLKESEHDGHIANGKPKHWHTIHVVVQKV